jgi:hypothetical protein
VAAKMPKAIAMMRTAIVSVGIEQLPRFTGEHHAASRRGELDLDQNVILNGITAHARWCGKAIIARVISASQMLIKGNEPLNLASHPDQVDRDHNQPLLTKKLTLTGRRHFRDRAQRA